MSITDVLVRVLVAAGGLSGLAALIIWGINKWGDQGGVGEKGMMSAIVAGVAFFAAAAFVAANGPTWFAQ